MSPETFLKRPWSPCKICDAIDFFRPEVIRQIARVGEYPRLHAKQWEYAQLLESWERFGSQGVAVGLGCGAEPTIPLIAETAREVIVTDLYDRRGAWDVARRRPDEVFGKRSNLRVHSMDMRKIDLEPESADFVWSLCAIEHVGGPAEIIDALRQAARLLKAGGHLFFSTEFNLGPTENYRTSATQFVGVELLREMIDRSGMFVVEPILIELSPHPMNTPLWARVPADYSFIPHSTYRHQRFPFYGTFATVVSVVLGRTDHGVPTTIVVDTLEEVLASLTSNGRRANRRLATPWRWW